MLSNGEAREFRQQLQERYAELREEIHQELLDSDDQHFVDLAGQVRDLEDESVADLLVDLDLTTIDRHIREIREIDAALARLDMGGYGTCEDCGSEIEADRLRAFPTARRCLDCQQVHERSHPGHGTPTI